MTGGSQLQPNWEKIVIRLKSEVIKGYVETPAVENIEGLLTDPARGNPAVLRVRRVDSNNVEDIAIGDAKAIFYVNSFEGDAGRRDLHFHGRARIIHSVWIRLEFLDGEIMEGLVDNTGRHLIDSGFFLRPTDPDSNNRLVYVLKSCVRDCRVLGLRDM